MGGRKKPKHKMDGGAASSVKISSRKAEKNRGIEAKKAFAAGDYVQAERLFDLVLSRNGDDDATEEKTLLKLNKAACLAGQRRYKDAVDGCLEVFSGGDGMYETAERLFSQSLLAISDRVDPKSGPKQEQSSGDSAKLSNAGASWAGEKTSRSALKYLILSDASSKGSKGSPSVNEEEDLDKLKFEVICQGLRDNASREHSESSRSREEKSNSAVPHTVSSSLQENQLAEDDDTQLSPDDFSDDKKNKKRQIRPPPTGLNQSELTLCDSVRYRHDCEFGSLCIQAHSESELDAWKSSLLGKQYTFSDSTGKLSLAKKIEQKLLEGADADEILKQSIKGVNFYMNEDFKVTLNTKPCSQVWLFTLACRDKLRTVTLLEGECKSNFRITSATIGQKRSQKPLTVPDDCTEWTNPKYTDETSTHEFVYRIKIHFKSSIYGSFKQNVVFDYGKSLPYLSQELIVEVATAEGTIPHDELIVIEGSRWEANKAITVVPYHDSSAKDNEDVTKSYPAPSHSALSTHIQTLKSGILNQDNYKEFYHALLHVEETERYRSVSKMIVQGNVSLMARFTQVSSTSTTWMNAMPGELFGQIPLGNKLSEDTTQGRLLLQGVNFVLLTPASSQSPSKVYECMIIEKGKDYVMINVNQQLVADKGWQADSQVSCQLQFVVNRIPFCQMHSAIDSTDSIRDSILFPQLDGAVSQWKPSRHRKETLVGNLPPLNRRQRECVEAISSDAPKVLPPLLIVGPFGTGKTMTMAQTVMKLIANKNRVLICTHSNSAADLYITDYLDPFVQTNPDVKLVRVYYERRWISSVSDVVRKYCLLNGGNFRSPTKEDLEKADCVIVTLSTCYSLTQLGLTSGMPAKGFFTHILIDEAAQALETETLLPLTLAGDQTRVALAGDHMQMNPEVNSDLARLYGLNKSLLDRLFIMYGSHHPCTVTLNENYRSHEAIVDFASDLFYDGQILASGKQPPHPSFYPLMFRAARGLSGQPENGTGYYNSSEVYETVDIIQELVKNWPDHVWGEFNESSVGVVAPYTDQVTRIRSDLKAKRNRDLAKVNVERVFNVQGKQYRVLVINTVRTFHSCSYIDLNKDYGFLSSPKVLNTAITRAQSLVIVIGDPLTLCLVGKCRAIWKRFVEQCSNHGALYGVTIQQINDYVDYLDRKKAYKLNPHAKDFTPTVPSPQRPTLTSSYQPYPTVNGAPTRQFSQVKPNVYGQSYLQPSQHPVQVTRTRPVLVPVSNQAEQNLQMLTDSAIIAAGAPVQAAVHPTFINHRVTASMPAAGVVSPVIVSGMPVSSPVMHLNQYAGYPMMQQQQQQQHNPFLYQPNLRMMNRTMPPLHQSYVPMTPPSPYPHPMMSAEAALLNAQLQNQLAYQQHQSILNNTAAVEQVSKLTAQLYVAQELVRKQQLENMTASTSPISRGSGTSPASPSDIPSASRPVALASTLPQSHALNPSTAPGSSPLQSRSDMVGSAFKRFETTSGKTSAKKELMAHKSPPKRVNDEDFSQPPWLRSRAPNASNNSSRTTASNQTDDYHTPLYRRGSPPPSQDLSSVRSAFQQLPTDPHQDVYTPEVRDIFRSDIANVSSTLTSDPIWESPVPDGSLSEERLSELPAWYTEHEADVAEDFSDFASFRFPQ